MAAIIHDLDLWNGQCTRHVRKGDSRDRCVFRLKDRAQLGEGDVEHVCQRGGRRTAVAEHGNDFVCIFSDPVEFPFAGIAKSLQPLIDALSNITGAGNQLGTGEDIL